MTIQSLGRKLTTLRGQGEGGAGTLLSGLGSWVFILGMLQTVPPSEEVVWYTKPDLDRNIISKRPSCASRGSRDRIPLGALSELYKNRDAERCIQSVVGHDTESGSAKSECGATQGSIGGSEVTERRRARLTSQFKK